MNKPLFFLLTTLSFFTVACSSARSKLFGTRTPHEAYAKSIEKKGLEDTPEGRQWLEASTRALEQAQEVKLPYRQQGSFPAGKPRALALEFTARQGQRIEFTIEREANASLSLFADIFMQQDGSHRHLQAADTTATQIYFDVPASGRYVLRLQPGLYQQGQYTLAAALGPSLSFPVGNNKGKVGSIWGDSREGGKRRHEGIDIFAPKGTPAVAAADGIITGVREGGIGGKTVWLRPEGKAIHLYYAHLDEWLVQEGQQVRKGDVLGTVGNTGNARTTPAHLHFGVYTFQGPVDPLPFVNRQQLQAPPLAAKKLLPYARLVKAQKTAAGELLKINTRLTVLASGTQGYIAELEDGRLLLLPAPALQLLKSEPPIRDVAEEKAKGASEKNAS
jgi:murein DD-endopeptidase MepM/ murein hydrolase activator NlpD